MASVEGVRVLALHNGDTLRLGVESPGGGILTVYVTSDDRVRVLHASEAIGEALYERGSDGEFALVEGWGEWDRSEDEAGQKAFMERHGWVASIGPMGPRGEREFALDLSRLANDVRIAISYADAPNYETLLTIPEGLTDGTSLTEVQRGFLPETLEFATNAWLTPDALRGEEDGE